MFGPFFNDLIEPHFISDLSAVTLAATAKALYPASAFPQGFAGFFNRPGRRLAIRLFGKITTAVTPGNLSIDAYYGTGADANGTIIVSSAAVALTASQTNISWELWCFLRCITPGPTGTLQANGYFGAGVGVLASTLQPVMIPASANAPSGAIDLSSAGIISLQAKRSGSTVETMTVQDMQVVALN
jgi:hypothetical protein